MHKERIINGIEQILTDFQEDFFIKDQLRPGYSFFLFQLDNTDAYLLYPDKKIHCIYGGSRKGEKAVSTRKAAETYFYDYLRPDPLNLPTATSVKLKLLRDLKRGARV